MAGDLRTRRRSLLHHLSASYPGAKRKTVRGRGEGSKARPPAAARTRAPRPATVAAGFRGWPLPAGSRGFNPFARVLRS